MSISDTLLPEFDQEMATTRRLLERVPTDKGPWKPHQKSFSLGHLAQLVAWMPGWTANTLRETDLNLAGAPGYSYEKTEDLLRMFDKNVTDAHSAIASSTDADYEVNWSLKLGDRVLMTPAAPAGRAHAHQPSDPPWRTAHRVPTFGGRSDSVHLRTDRGRESARFLDRSYCLAVGRKRPGCSPCRDQHRSRCSNTSLS